MGPTPRSRDWKYRLGLTILIATILSLLFPVFAPGASVGLVLGGGYIYFSSSREEVRSLASIAVLVGAVFFVLILYFFVGMSVVSYEKVTLTETVSPGVEAHTVSVYGRNRLGQDAVAAELGDVLRVEGSALPVEAVQELEVLPHGDPRSARKPWRFFLSADFRGNLRAVPVLQSVPLVEPLVVLRGVAAPADPRRRCPSRPVLRGRRAGCVRG